MAPGLTAWLVPIFRPFFDRPFFLNTLRLLFAFSLMLVPSTAMGATLPLLVRALCAKDPRFGEVLGRLYGWNTLGAVAGALVGEITLVARFGIRGTGLVAGLLDILAAATAAVLSRGDGGEEVPAAADMAGSARSPGARRLLAAALLCGAILLALEVVWFRFLGMFVPNTSLAFVLMLVAVLFGIGAGGLVASWWLKTQSTASHLLRPIALASGILTIAVYAAFRNANGSDLVWIRASLASCSASPSASCSRSRSSRACSSRSWAKRRTGRSAGRPAPPGF